MKEDQPRPVDVLEARIKYDSEMLEFLYEKRKLVQAELVRIDGQIVGVREDRLKLKELQVQRPLSEKMLKAMDRLPR